MVKNLSANAGDRRDKGLIPGSGRSPRGENGNPLQYSCLGNPMDRETWWAIVRRVTKSQTRLGDLSSRAASQGEESVRVATVSGASLPSLDPNNP